MVLAWMISHFPVEKSSGPVKELFSPVATAGFSILSSRIANRVDVIMKRIQCVVQLTKNQSKELIFFY